MILAAATAIAAPLGARAARGDTIARAGHTGHLAISNVSAGVHTLRAGIGGQWVERRVTVTPGVMTWVEFRP